jgi:hypothetical protein
MRKFLTIMALLLSVAVIISRARAQMSSDLAPASIFHAVTTPSGHPKPFQNDLHSVSASSPNDIWAVGQTGIHFDGTKWTAFPMPLIKGDNTSKLAGVVDFAPNNVWAVGLTGISLGTGNQVIEHFNGAKWSLFPGPKFQSGDQPSLESLTANSPSDMWAGGFILTNGGRSLFPLFEHFDGTKWTALETQFQGGTIFGISADATNDAWAVGNVGVSTTFIEHWDGRTWTVVPSPSPGAAKGGADILNGVVALAPNDVWAAGTSMPGPTPPPPLLDTPTITLIEHFDGTSWTVVPSPSVGPHSQFQSNQLWGITGVSASDVWAFGSVFPADGSGQESTLVLHWNGTSWKVVPSPSPFTGNFRNDILFGGTVIPQGDLWLVGNEFGRTLALNATGQ